jgi:hypothetical protein
VDAGADSEADEDQGSGGDEFNIGQTNKQEDLTGRRVLRQTASRKRAKAVSRTKRGEAVGPVQNHTPVQVIVRNVDPQLFPTPSPSPTPMLSTTNLRPMPRAKITLNPSRIQPSRKGKGN